MDLLIHLVFLLLILGMVLWCIGQIPGLPAPIKSAASIVVVLLAAIWLLQNSGMLHI